MTTAATGEEIVSERSAMEVVRAGDYDRRLVTYVEVASNGRS